VLEQDGRTAAGREYMPSPFGNHADSPIRCSLQVHIADILAAYNIKKLPSGEEASQASNLTEAYGISNIIAHQAATDFAKTASVDIVRVLPGLSLGSNELNDSAKDMHFGSNGSLISMALGEIVDRPKLTGQVLLENVAKTHILALDPKIALNLTNFVIAGSGGKGISWDEVAALIERLYPDQVKAGVLKPAKGQESLLTNFDIRSSEKALGSKFAGIEVMVKSVIDRYLRLL